MKPLKDIYTHPGVFKELSFDLKAVFPKLKEDAFYLSLVADLDKLELKARIERTADVCHQYLPKNYLHALKILDALVQGKENRLIYLFLPAYVAKYGQHDYQASMNAIRIFTEYSSSEEGIRTFIELDPDRTLAIMRKWAQSKNTHVRRLASEGCRPRLPWARKISFLIERPTLTWHILEALKTDSEKYVQKSVANHINDISKDHPDWVVKRVKRWNLSHPSTGWIVKHGMRTLIKQGHKGALDLFGNAQKPQIKISHEIWNKRVLLGDTCSFAFNILSTSRKDQSLMIDYKISFFKKNGSQLPKTFKLKRILLGPNKAVLLTMKYRFKDMSTRKHYPGPHAWQLLINGEALELYPFVLKKCPL